MKRTATSLLLVGLLLCTQALLAACGVRCSVGMDMSHTAALQAMEHCTGMNATHASRPATSGVISSPCCEQSCNQREVTEITSSSEDTFAQSAIGLIHAHPLPGLSPHMAIAPVGQHDLDPAFRLKPADVSTQTILNIRV